MYINIIPVSSKTLLSFINLKVKSHLFSILMPIAAKRIILTFQKAFSPCRKTFVHSIPNSIRIRVIPEILYRMLKLIFNLRECKTTLQNNDSAAGSEVR